MVWNADFEKAFYPGTIAIAGVSADAKRGQMWTGSGAGFIMSLEQLGFPGQIFPVNPKATQILSYRAYPSLVDIPVPVDLVIMAVPAIHAPAVLEDCIKANAKNIHMFTAGFEETGEKEAIELGRQVREIAKRGELRIVGPNCMGLFVPEACIGTFDRLPKESGDVAFITQSGGHLNWYAHYAPHYGFYLNKGISFGNAYVFDSTDYLEYIEKDEKCRYICLYLEGVKNGRKLREQVESINRSRPVIIWKSGLTPTGARAVASHTASLAGEEKIWQGFFQQTGAVQVNSLEEMAEMTMTFRCLPPAAGNRIAVMSLGGGTGVSAADVCSREGLEMPALSQTTQDELKKFISLAGASIRNPLDTGMVFTNIEKLKRELEIVISDPVIDMIVMMPHLDMTRHITTELIDCIREFAQKHPSRKPVAVVFHDFNNDPWEAEMRAKLKRELPHQGIAVYSSLVSACRALSRFAVYHRIQREMVS